MLQHKVENLQELCGQKYDAVINCSGVQARNLVDDSSVQPVRGQVLRVSVMFRTNYLTYFINNTDLGNM